MRGGLRGSKERGEAQSLIEDQKNYVRGLEFELGSVELLPGVWLSKA
jgi:hypothetical protein